MEILALLNAFDMNQCLFYLQKPNDGSIRFELFSDFRINLKSASNLNGNLNCSKELEHYAS